MKSIYFAIVGALVCAVLLVPAAEATVVKNIYTASVPAADQSSAARSKALRAALTVVVVKVTGSRSAVSSPGLTDFLAHPERALQRYRYQRVQPIALPGHKPTTRGRRAQSVLHLWAKFDSASVTQALRSAGLPIWGRERPLTLVWLAKQGNHTRAVLSADTNVPLEQFMKRKARKRGMAIALPLMDLQDQRQVSFSDIAGGFTDRIRQASARYRPDGILVGNLHEIDAGEWRASWRLLLGQNVVSWKTQPGRLAKVGADGINGAANYYARRFALQSKNPGARGVEVDVSSINTIAAYAQVLDFLKSLTPVRNLQVERVAGAKVRFRLDARGKLDNLREAIRLGDILQPVKPLSAKPKTTARLSRRNSKGARTGGALRAPAREPVKAVLQYRYTP